MMVPIQVLPVVVSPDYLDQAEQLSKIAAAQFHDPHIGSAQLMSAHILQHLKMR